MGRSAQIKLVLYEPKTEEAQRELKRQTARLHAELVTNQIQRLRCSTQQKRELLDAVIDTVQKSEPDL